MGSEPDNITTASTEKTTYDKTFKTMRIGACEMQGWRSSMEDAAIVLPNFESHTSLFGVLDGHGGSIISEFVSVNFKNVLVRCKSYKKGHYDKALLETFLLMDELLKNKKINNFIYETHYQKAKEKQKEEKNIYNKNKNENIVKLRFESGELDFDLDEIDLGNEKDSYETVVFDYKNKLITKKNLEKIIETSSTAADDSKIRIDTESNKDEEKSSKNLQLSDIFFQQSGKLNSSLNGLPSFDEVFDIKKCRLKFHQKQKPIQQTQEDNNSSNSLKYQPFIAYEMGTTANIMLIKNNIIYLANVGDSVSVMYRDGKAYNLNREHQVVIESEKERITQTNNDAYGHKKCTHHDTPGPAIDAHYLVSGTFPGSGIILQSGRILFTILLADTLGWSRAADPLHHRWLHSHHAVSTIQPTAIVVQRALLHTGYLPDTRDP